MKISIVIVSYNVYPFLDNCLRSVRQALHGIEGEIIVVDNASVDRTPQLIQTHFPDIILIANPVNLGFARANNQGIQIAKGEYILLLNPDTVLSENTLSVCETFMEQHPDAGAVGVRMIDGSGKFLPESKRGLPTLLASFMKMTGLYHLAPRSKSWNRYYQGQIREDEVATIEVLTGAFMFIRKTALEKSGLLDEDFFMYGEDIDLSYRITKAGYAIYYLPTTSIIHYKGESTKKASLNYLLTFYNAMLIFTQKHPEFKGQRILIQLAIYLHGFTRLLNQFISRAWPVLKDGILLYGSFYSVSWLWSRYFYHDPHYFKRSFYVLSIPLYVVLILLSMFLHGAYDLPKEKRRAWLGFFTGIILVLVVYAFLPVHLRTSRMVIALGSILFSVILLISRSKTFQAKKQTNLNHSSGNRNAVIAAGPEEANRIKELINRSRDHIDIIGIISPENGSVVHAQEILGNLTNLKDIVRVHDVKEIIFSAQDVPFFQFAASMSALGPGYRYMLAASTTMNIVGSMNRDTEGESYGLRINFKLSHPTSRRSKRIFDFVSATALLIGYPILILFIPRKLNALKNIFQVWIGRKTWVAYNPLDQLTGSLPPLKAGVLYPVYSDSKSGEHLRLEHIHYVYARDYHWTNDIVILAEQLNRIGQNDQQ